MGHTATATITATALTKDTASATMALAGGTAFTDASTLEVAYPKEGALLIRIYSDYAGANTAIIEAGEYTAAGKGSITVTTAQSGVYYIVVSSDRCKDWDGMVNITFGTSATGYVRAFTIPT